MTKAKKPTPPPTPPKAHPWDRPQFPVRGDRDVKNTYEWVGQALSAWETFEASFGAIFGILVGDSDLISPAMRAYGSIISFKGKRDLVIAAGAAFFLRYPHPAAAFLDDILEEANGWSGRRNDIAHGVVQLYYPEGKAADGTVLGPSQLATSKHKLTRQDGEFPFKITPTFAYSSAELMIFTRDFGLLARKTHGYQRNLFLEARRLRAKPPKA
jgi:hypothetical protein